ncbi:MAG TPA: PQQ-binding-like beta-propeller repeat protein [Terriglobales bacterium]|jgi:Ca-activated chloride channel family protein|nr:PQQ-binding-like beta-propeller repeat protein [Terriglobales bacterium]
MKYASSLSLVALAAVALALLAAPRKPALAGEPAAPAPKELKLDLSKAVPVSLPTPKAGLTPVAFRTSDGKAGWVVRIPGGRPIATPAYADGMLFVGGGYGSHEFYAFDAETGALRWKVPTSDDGPTAAVVEAGYVAFNTESCTVIVVDEKTGKIVWQEWLGDPLMSQPAIADGRLFMAFPAGQRGPGPQDGYSHALLAVDLKSGKHLWVAGITSDAISAPVVADGHVYVTCFDGTSFAFDAADGRLLWKKENAGTSAPVIANNQFVVAQKQVAGAKNYEGLMRADAAHGTPQDKDLLTKKEAAYLDQSKGGGTGLTTSQTVALDSSVGFGAAPASAGLGAAQKNVGVGSVVGGWAYQGSRAAVSRGRLLNAQGKYLNAVAAADGKLAWQAEVVGAGVNGDQQVFAPPSLGRDYLYLSGPLGHLVSVRQKDGAPGFMYSLRQPMIFQPALANGNIYVGTANGSLICLKLSSPDADGWYEWGGNAQHNKIQ